MRRREEERREGRTFPSGGNRCQIFLPEIFFFFLKIYILGIKGGNLEHACRSETGQSAGLFSLLTSSSPALSTFWPPLFEFC